MSTPSPENPKNRQDKAAETNSVGSLQALLRLGTRHIRRLLVFIVGSTVLLIGIIMLVTPGPAVVVIPIGLGILGMEFAWARRLLQRFKDGAKKASGGLKGWFRRRKKGAVSISALTIYPCKSLRGISLDSVRLEARGLQDDRRWMVVDAGGEFITQRQQPRMALLDVQLTDEGLLISLEGGEPVCASRGGGEVSQVTVWRDEVEAESCGGEVDQWLSDFLAQPCRVVYMPERVQRRVDPQYAQPQDQVSFADGFPLLLISEASLAALNEKLEQPVSMEHFRPNVVVTGCEAFAEDEWKKLNIEAVELSVVKPCSRCVITTIDPKTGEKDPQQQPLKTLVSFRKQGKEVCFGQNVIPRKTGVLQVGQKVTVVDVAR